MTNRKSRAAERAASGLIAAFTAMLLSMNVQAQTANGPTAEEQHARYMIQQQDVLAVTFPLSPELNQTITVQPDGYINLQDTGSVYVKGLTVPALTLAIKKAYKGILNDPMVSVDIQDYQKPFFTVSGQVGKPGQYELRADITILEGIAVAGGMTMATAKTQVFLFHRSSKDWYEVKKINLKAVLNGKHTGDDGILMPGDMIYVPEKFIATFRKYVPYTVNAGTYLNPGVL